MARAGAVVAMIWLTSSLAGAVAAAGPMPAAGTHVRYAAAALDAPADAVSSNWSGYAVTSAGTAYTSVTSTWTQPKATCGTGDAGAAAAFWVGLGGYALNSQALEQAGTDSDCDSTNRPSYYAWYEIVPAPPVNVRLKIAPGDTITASVNIRNNNSAVLFQIKNRSRGTVFTKLVTLTAAPDLSSAEWIAEAPSSCTQTSCRPLPLANFGSVAFTKVAALGNGNGGTVANPAWTAEAISLVPRANRGFFPGPDSGSGSSGSTAGASPGGLASDGSSFTVGWTASPASPG